MDDIIMYTKDVAAVLELAETLGNKEVIILFTKHDPKNKATVEALQQKTVMKLAPGLLITSTKEAQKQANHYVLVGEATRTLIENKQITYLCNAELVEDKDKTHRRGSGLNQVTAKLLADKQKTYCFNLHTLLHGNQARILGRMQQNKQVLQKYECTTACYSFATTPLELRGYKERKLFIEQL